MKTILASILSAVIGGLILWGTQTWWQSRSADARHQIDFNLIANNVTFDQKSIDLLKKAVSQYERVSLLQFSVKNIGTADIADKSFSVADVNIKGFGTVLSPNQNPTNAAISYQNEVLRIYYKLLPAKAEHIFYLLKPETVDTTGKFASDSPGMTVTNSPDPYADLAFPWFWFFALVVLFIAFLVGSAVGYGSLSMEIAKRGLDPAEILKMKPATDT